ncbi:MAG: GYD domain-containing protein [Pseudomonadota bacterium]
MAYYMMRGKFSQHAMGALVQRPEDRMLTTTKLLKGVGGRLHYYFFCFGEYDFVLLFELPDNVSAAALAMTMSASGSVNSIDTTVLMTMEEAISAMRIAGDASGVYQPPGRGLEARSGSGKAGEKSKARR